MDDNMWRAEYMAKPLPSGLFAPLVFLQRDEGEGTHESQITYTGQYPTWQEAADAARRLHTSG